MTKALLILGLLSAFVLHGPALSVTTRQNNFSEAQAEQEEKKLAPGCYVIRKIDYPIFKRVSPKNKTEKKICLLNICPENRGKVARPVIEVEVDGKKTFREFDVAKVFKDRAEAEAFAKKHDIKDARYD
jgi:hypothetical protein